ncbi:MAG TPA: UDP-3-O-(3-hydroxymyristoyl)glucosamine N-acyltransferase [Phycisphaerae bacterium]|jgi:UDP-3-O-[3-hydroxymyristoyl] glucosamine N-acyltransferase
MGKSFTISELADRIGGTVRGDGSVRVGGLGALRNATPDQITWLSQERYAALVPESRAGAILIPENFGATRMPAILCSRMDRAVATLLDIFAPPVPEPPRGRHPSAIVDPTARIGVEVAIGAHVVIEAGAAIGDRTTLYPGVCIGSDARIGRDCVLWQHVVVRERCVLGERVIVHPNAVIGADGFGYYQQDGRHQKITHGGYVLIEDDVEIGAGSCIDRAKFGATTVGAGTKIDNLVQVGHNVEIGPHCLIVAQVGISGSTRLGHHVVLAGQVGLSDHIVLGDGATVVACSCVARDVPPGMCFGGNLAIEHRKSLREQAAMRRLPDLVAQVRRLIKRVEQLEAGDRRHV